MTPLRVALKPVLAGEAAVIIYLQQQPGPDCLQLLHYLSLDLRQRYGNAITELLPSYQSLLVQLNPERLDPFQLIAQLPCQYQAPTILQQQKTKCIELPVCYGDELTGGPLDLPQVSNHTGLSIRQIKQLHQQQSYQVYAIGFAPGFAYLGQLPTELSMPRRSTPRAQVPKGAVAIADRQTAVYPAASPGGWNLFGLCPVPLFRPELLGQEGAMPFSSGDKVRFYAISQADYVALGGALDWELK